MEARNVFDVVMTLIGPVTAVGESTSDEIHLRNMKALTSLIDSLLFVVSDQARHADRQEHSMKLIGEHAKSFIQEIKEAD